MEKHPIEASDSWDIYSRKNRETADGQRRLKHHTTENVDLVKIEHDKEVAYLRQQKKTSDALKKKTKKKHLKRMKRMYADPGIQVSTVHGMMIDAGSTGSRLHLYEWEPRILSSHHEVEAAVSGKKLSFPSSESRWTDKLRPGLATFATLPDDELQDKIAEYLSPLIDFAKTVLREKQNSFGDFPIFLRATAGMRTLSNKDRSRVLDAVRSLFNDVEFCPFYFENEYARVLSGEEEAIFGWTGLNFIMGNLIEESEGAGTVVNPKLTYGALDMGGASTQISFYEPHEDIMANLFKLQIGQGKHWNLYAHSFLYYGLNAARDRFAAQLLNGEDANSRLIGGVHNPCLPGGSRSDIRLNIHVDNNGDETWDYDSDSSDNGFYQAILTNENDTGDFEHCLEATKSALHLEKNSWCDFAHRGDCSFNGVSMPRLPTQSENFGEFLAFSNYYHVWNFLGLPMRSSLGELYDATKIICSMNKQEIFEFNLQHAQYEDDAVEDFCFRAAYSFNILRNGYGFQMDDHITATDVLNGQKVGWAIGAMLYEINTFPWVYKEKKHTIAKSGHAQSSDPATFILAVVVGFILSLLVMFANRRSRNRSKYEPVKDVEKIPLM